MAKEISMGMWVSVIPDKMYKGWIKTGWIPKGATDFEETNKKADNYIYVLEKDGVRHAVDNILEYNSFIKVGWKRVYKRYRVKSLVYGIMQDEVGKWYKEVFEYVTNWFKKHGYIKLVKGSFSGGFCAETDPNSQVVKGWGAPLAKEGNKVVQIKEKFGYIVVYLDSLTKQERAQINRFAKYVEKKFDCRTRFN